MSYMDPSRSSHRPLNLTDEVPVAAAAFFLFLLLRFRLALELLEGFDAGSSGFESPPDGVLGVSLGADESLDLVRAIVDNVSSVVYDAFLLFYSLLNLLFM